MELDLDVVQPEARPIIGGVLFLHWFAPQDGGDNKTQFADEARDLAAEGVVSVLPQLIFPWSVDPAGSAVDSAQIEAELARLTQAVDRLVELGARQIVMVGHDYGAMYGLLLMARDKRMGAGVVIAPSNRWADWNVRFWKVDEDRLDYMRAMRSLDPIEHVASIAPRPLLMQFADRDYFIAGMDAAELYRAAGEPRQIEEYEADHAMRNLKARADRREFVLEALRS
ncbi:MAG: alpha/beta fold hydrolase [Candidatus Limnocylindrales bacterium]